MLTLEGFAATTFIQTIRVKIHVYKSGTYGGIRPKSNQVNNRCKSKKDIWTDQTFFILIPRSRGFVDLSTIPIRRCEILSSRLT